MIEIEEIGEELTASTPLPMRVSGRYTGGMGPLVASQKFKLRPRPLLPRTTEEIAGVSEVEVSLDIEDEAEEGAIPRKPVIPYRYLLSVSVDTNDGREDPLEVISGDVFVGSAFPSRAVRRVHFIAEIQKRQVSGNSTILSARGIDLLVPIRGGLRGSVKLNSLQMIIDTTSRNARLQFFNKRYATQVLSCRYRSRYFREVEIELDREKDAWLATTFDTWSLPARPPDLPQEILSVDDVYEKAGIGLMISPFPDEVSLPPGGTWSNRELHDSMEIHWSRYRDVAQWKMWGFSGKLHEMGSGLGGIMFDWNLGRSRQGFALFSDSSMHQAAWSRLRNDVEAKRMFFYNIIHESGHAFNLLHSWQKALLAPWDPGLQNRPNSRSFMNYPHRFPGPYLDDFFEGFYWKFDREELLFMRHAPVDYVIMGGREFGQEHGISLDFQAGIQDGLQLILKPREYYEYLEPIAVEVELHNPMEYTFTVEHVLDLNWWNLQFVVTSPNGDQHTYYPLAHYCGIPKGTSVEPGKSVEETVFLTFGKEGYYFKEPGEYVIQAHYTDDLGNMVISRPVSLRVAPPTDPQIAQLAPAYLTEEVGRVVHFGGSRILTDANKVLEQIATIDPQSNLGRFASAILGKPLVQGHKVVTSEKGKPLKLISAEPKEGIKWLDQALSEGEKAFERLGDRYASSLIDHMADGLVTAKQEKDAMEKLKENIEILQKRKSPEDLIHSTEEKLRKLTKV